MKNKITERAHRAIQDKVFPGCVVGVVHTSGEKIVLPFGRFTYEVDSKEVQSDTIYDVASVTKMIPLSSALLWFIDRGEISLDAKITEFIPEFGTSEEKQMVTVRHLLTYTVDLDVPSMSTLKDRSAKELMEIVIRAPLRRPSGTSLLYTNSTAALIGALLWRFSGKMIDVLADDIFFRPLGMNQATFHPENTNTSLIPPTEIDSWRGRVVQGEVHDESTAIMQKEGIYLGVSGLFSPASDLLIFLEMLLRGGELNGTQYFSEGMVERMHTNQLESIGEKVGLGWDLGSRHKMGDLCSDQTFGHTGFTGTMVTCDPAQDVGIVILSNRTYPKRSATSDAINSFRHDISDIIFSSLSEKNF